MTKLVKFRNDNNLTQIELSKKIGVSKSYYQKIETGERTPSYEFVRKFNEAFPDAAIKNIFFS